MATTAGALDRPRARRAPRREAHEPAEARGLARDAVRMLVATRGRRARPRPRARAPRAPARRRRARRQHVGDAARRAARAARRRHGAAPAPLDARRRGGRGRWVVELRDGGARFAGGRAGETLALPAGARATLLAPYLTGARLWLAQLAHRRRVRCWTYLAEHGAPIRYGYVAREWPLADYQTVFATQPGSAEMPSAGRPFTPALVTALVTRGIAVAPVMLHTGVSSQEAGELPYPERYAVPASTARLVNAARAGGGRVVAVGTTVVRALETVARPDGSSARARAGRTTSSRRRPACAPSTGC